MTSVVTDLAAPLRPNGIIQTVPDVFRLQIYFLTALNQKAMAKFGCEYDEEITITNIFLTRLRGLKFLEPGSEEVLTREPKAQKTTSLSCSNNITKIKRYYKRK